ncbi:caspase recruitment domain-containing protein 16 isoform X5 [Piliocolobus tephrosceles]|uniref:caspase recruitment domain-containing protein 16 isoform X5 n=1 Tax=Piliocolobus tephrosceles TaxID=591936 RepID=UPI000E6B4535|nr:caspase recruitment domain-containing protein 16 isoform X5 [Piliocolobus tephrosceles]
MQATILILSLGRKIKICICMCSGCFPVCAHTLPKRKVKHTFSFSPHKKGRREEPWPTRVLNQEEMEKVKRENPTVMDKARAVIDSVIRKGAQASQIFITYICEEDRYLAGTLGLSAAPQAVQDNPAMSTSSSPEGSIKLCFLEEPQRIWKQKSQRLE